MSALFIGKQSRETQKICILQWNHAITNIYIQTGFNIYCNIILSWVESERNSSFMRILYVWRGSYCIRIHICICTHVCVYTYIYLHTYILISEHVRWAWQQDQHSISSKTTKRNKRNINIMGASRIHKNNNKKNSKGNQSELAKSKQNTIYPRCCCCTFPCSSQSYRFGIEFWIIWKRFGIERAHSA